MCDCNKDYSFLAANTGIAAISSANSSLTGASSTAVITAGGANGTLIKSLTIKATGPVTTGMVRLFVGNNSGSSISLYKEIPVPTTPALSATPTPLPMLLTYECNLGGGLKLEDGYKLSASTQNGEPFNLVAEGLDITYPSPIPDTCCSFNPTCIFNPDYPYW
jgi:hypothetical protein